MIAAGHSSSPHATRIDTSAARNRLLSPGLVKRLSHTQTFKGHSSTVNALDWSSDGEILLSGSDDCRVKLWSAESGKAVQSFDSGHTSSIYVTKFMPNTGNEQIITSAADRQVRLVNLQRSAVKPYTFHHGRVKALVPLDPFMFISGSDDGTVRHYDTREPASTSSIPGMRTGDVLADQRHERTPRGRAKVSINAVAVDPMRPYLFVTGSSDPLMRLYDRRMSLQRGHSQSPSGRSWPQWVSCFIPTSLKTDTMQPRTGTERASFVTSVKFSGGGDQVIASYSGDNIYSFDCVDHARESEGYCTAQGWSRPNSAFGTRSASRHAVLHASATGTAVSDGHAARQASDQSLPPDIGQPQATIATQTDEVAQPASSAAVSSQAHAGRDSNHAHPRQVPASVATVDSSGIRTGEPHVEGDVPCEQANLPAASSGLSVPVTVDVTRPGPPVEREGLTGKGTGQLAERLPAAPRPPLPFHPIRRSARLHKSAGNAPGTAAMADEEGLEVGNTPASSAQNDIKAEAAGPCTRHSCKRKLAELSESAIPVSDQPLAGPDRAACVASSRRLEQPTASTGTSRPAPLAHRGTSMQASQAGETVPLGPPDFLRLQYSTDPPSSAYNSRESTPDQAAEVTRPNHQAVQAGAAGISTEFPRPSRHTRRARASRLAPLPATSAAHDPHKASATLPLPDPPDIVSRHMDDAAHSGACSGHDIGAAISASTEARACSCNGLEDPQADPQAEPGADAEPMVQQPREGTPVSSNRRHYRARGRASVEASNAPRAPLWRPGSSTLATAELSNGNSPRGSHNHSIQPACAEHQVQEAELAGTAEEEVLSPHQSRHSHVKRTSQPGDLDQTPADGCHEDYSREGQMQPHGSHNAQLTGVVDSFVGAIVQEGSDDDGDGEVVEEWGMFQQCYKGHCNLSLNKGVCLLGSRDEYVASGSDDGRIFVWDRFNGRLVNMLSSDDQSVSCVAAHPSMPVLASAGSEPVIKLWSPQAEFACNLERAEAIMSHNAQELAEGDRRSNLAGPPPMWLNMLGTAVSAELRAPGEAYTDLDNIARLALAAICRSCHVRLRSDTFAGILDDSPTLRGVVSSSTLHAMQHINNFLLRDKLGDKWTMAVSEEGLKSKGFMTVIAARDTRAAGNVPHVCKMQVKDALGSWKDVRLGPHEVAIMFGQTATQASAGLFRPAIYRVVGELYSSCHGNQVHTGRQSVAYHLNARPSAVLNFHDILEEAGHSRSIQLGTIDAAAAKKKRKRQVTPVSSPVTRSGRVRRSTAGLLGEPAHAKSSHANEAQKRGDFAAMVQAMRVYLTVDGNTSCPTDFLPIGISHYQTMNMTWFRAHPMAPCCRIFESYCESMGLELMHVRFLRQSGLRVQGSELLMDLKLAEDETLAMHCCHALLPTTSLRLVLLKQHWKCHHMQIKMSTT
ncbi:hypothetical protein WJX82_004928 [Trebouxia sp. C0006]